MKRKIFALGLLSLAFSANAQSLLGVQDQASLHIKEGTLIYGGGELKTVGSGVVDNFGNVMIVGGGVKTVTTTNAPKTDGGNIILRLLSMVELLLNTDSFTLMVFLRVMLQGL